MIQPPCSSPSCLLFTRKSERGRKSPVPERHSESLREDGAQFSVGSGGSGGSGTFLPGLGGEGGRAASLVPLRSSIVPCSLLRRRVALPLPTEPVAVASLSPLLTFNSPKSD